MSRWLTTSCGCCSAAASYILVAMRTKEPFHRRRSLKCSLNGKPVLVHEANDLLGARRFVRIATEPIVNVMVKAHSAGTIVVVEHIAERVSARCRNRGEVRGFVHRANEEANRWRRAAIKSFFFLPETACWRSPINRNSQQPSGANECRHMLKCAPHCAGVMENTPTVHDVIGSSGQVEQIRGMHGPVLSNIEPRQKLACGVDAVGGLCRPRRLGWCPVARRRPWTSQSRSLYQEFVLLVPLHLETA